MGISKSASTIMRRMLLVALVLVLILSVYALPAAADDFGPAFFCDAQAFTNCTDTSDPALAEDTFSCEGTVGDVASCTNQITGESTPYCVFMGEDMGEGGPTNRDAYLCGAPQDFSNQTGDQFWYFVCRGCTAAGEFTVIFGAVVGMPLDVCCAVLRVELQTGWRQPVTLPGGRRPRSGSRRGP
jgi:hypothetical protein